MRSVGEDDCSDLARKVLSVVMERDDLKKYYDLLETDEKSPPGSLVASGDSSKSLL